MLVKRPVVRSFQKKYEREAGAHVRAGGHAIVWESASRAVLVFRAPSDDDPSDLGYWALLDLGKSRWKKVPAGALRGLGAALVPKDALDIVRHWVERDSVWPGARRAIDLDCLACGACCRDNRVELDDDDVARIRDGGRADLLRAPFTRKDDGKLVLRLLKSKDCRHLASDNKCGIYELRPSACSMFPVGSECCLFAREEELEVVDGLDEDAKVIAGPAAKRAP